MILWLRTATAEVTIAAGRRSRATSRHRCRYYGSRSIGRNKACTILDHRGSGRGWHHHVVGCASDLFVDLQSTIAIAITSVGDADGGDSLSMQCSIVAAADEADHHLLQLQLGQLLTTSIKQPKIGRQATAKGCILVLVGFNLLFSNLFRHFLGHYRLHQVTQVYGRNTSIWRQC